MAQVIQIKRGLKTALAGATIATGELVYITDESALYTYNGTSKVKLSDVGFYTTVGDFPATGLVDKIYLDKTNSKQYFWDGSTYKALTTDLTSIIDDSAIAGEVGKTYSVDKILTLLGGKLDKLVGATQDTIILANSDGTLKLTNEKLADYAKLVTGKIPEALLPDGFRNEIYVVADSVARLAIVDMHTGAICYETVTGDSYIYNEGDTSWKVMADKDWANITIDWASLTGKPTSSVADIDDAVTKKHSHANSAVLDATTASFTTALETKVNGVADGATKVESSLTNGNIKINGVETAVYNDSAINTAIGLKANSADVYLKTETYTQTEVDNKFTNLTIDCGTI